MKNFGYIRRSSAETNASYSIDSQKRIIRELAAKDNVNIDDIHFIVDNGYSGENVKRPGLQKLLRKLATTDKGSTVYIWMSSRLSRNTVYTHSLRCVFDKYDIPLKSYNNDWATLDEMKNSPDKSLLPNIIGAADAAEIARDRNRTLIGLKTSSQIGRNYTKGGGTPPTGWIFVKNESEKGRKVELDIEFVPTVLYICEQIHDAKRSIDSIAMELDNKQCCGVKWSYSKVYKLVTNKLLYGCLDTSWVTVEDHSPCYISKAYFYEMQKVLHGRKKEKYHTYLYKNMILCNDCKELCSEIPTIHYPRHLKNKRNKRENVSTVYKYYFCPNCRKRINENTLFKNMTLDIHNILTKDNSKNELIIQLKGKVSRINKKIDFLNNEYEDGNIDDEYYKKECRLNLNKVKDINDQIKTLDKMITEKISELSYRQLKHLIHKYFIEIEVNLKDNEVIKVTKRVNENKKNK